MTSIEATPTRPGARREPRGIARRKPSTPTDATFVALGALVARELARDGERGDLRVARRGFALARRSSLHSFGGTVRCAFAPDRGARRARAGPGRSRRCRPSSSCLGCCVRRTRDATPGRGTRARRARRRRRTRRGRAGRRRSGCRGGRGGGGRRRRAATRARASEAARASGARTRISPIFAHTPSSPGPVHAASRGVGTEAPRSRAISATRSGSSARREVASALTVANHAPSDARATSAGGEGRRRVPSPGRRTRARGARRARHERPSATRSRSGRGTSARRRRRCPCGGRPSPRSGGSARSTVGTTPGDRHRRKCWKVVGASSSSSRAAERRRRRSSQRNVAALDAGASRATRAGTATPSARRPRCGVARRRGRGTSPPPLRSGRRPRRLGSPPPLAPAALLLATPSSALPAPGVSPLAPPPLGGGVRSRVSRRGGAAAPRLPPARAALVRDLAPLALARGPRVVRRLRISRVRRARLRRRSS